MTSRSTRTVGLWLLSASLLVLAMIILGGITRLTRSGLSITSWDPIRGVLPPLGDSEWADAFDRYRASPEGRLVAGDMNLDAFRHIYAIEWAHRVLGRVIAIWLLVPLVVLTVRRRLPSNVGRRVLGVLIIGALQAGLGWYMVASGLVDLPHVSPYRMTAHFLVGALLFAVLLWSTLEVLLPPVGRRYARGADRAAVMVVVAVTLLTLGWGALMAGHHAGLVFSDFPTMGGSLVPLRGRTVRIADLVADGVAVHFIHRLLALALLASVIGLLFVLRRSSYPRRTRALAASLLVAVTFQAALGALTVVHHVPLLLASCHQGMGMVVVALLVALTHELMATRRADCTLERP